MISSLKKLLKKGHGDGLTIITGGKLDITKRLIEKMHATEKSNMIILYENYENLKDDFYKKYENEESNKSSLKNFNKIQVFNCDLKIQEDKEELISFLENNKLKVKLHKKIA